MTRAFAVVLWVAVLLQYSSGGEIRGLNPSRKALYKPGSDFTCFDGSDIIPFSLINDDYCDCNDGSDEPGTSACPNAKFHCVNEGHRPLNLLSSRVNDKVCDCCDGSDEWDTDLACPNTCQEMGTKALEEAIRLKEVHDDGHKKRLEYSIQGKEKMERSKADLAQKNADLEVINAEVEALAAAKDAAEEPERAEKEEHQKRWDDEREARREEARLADVRFGFDELDTNSDGSVTVEELRSRYELDDNEDGETSEEEALEYLGNQQSVDFDTFHSTVWDAIADKCQFQRPTPTPPSIVPPSIEPQDREEDSDLEDEEEEEDDDDEDEEEDEDDDDVPTQENEQAPEYDEATKELIAAAEAARAAHREGDTKKGNLEREIKDINKYLEISYGLEGEFSPLYEQCYEYTDREYVYKMCAFDKVTQRSKSGGRETTLGKWGNWNGPLDDIYSVMRYENGEKCWNGPNRSATITLVCGIEDKLLSAGEPNRCEYAMEFSTPAVCELIKHPAHEEL